jgi:Ras-related protein Rab-5C
VKELQRRGDPNVVIALAGNKADMEGKRKVQTEEAQQYAQENDIIFLETSAKTALNVRNLFVEIGKLQGHFGPYAQYEPTIIVWSFPCPVLWWKLILLSAFATAAKKLPKVPLVAERESFPIVPPKGKEKSSCC